MAAHDEVRSVRDAGEEDMKKQPTKEEIMEARAKRKQARAMLREAYKVLRKTRKGRRTVRFVTSPETRDFFTWEHDYETLARAVIRTQGSYSWSPEQIAQHAGEAADRMKHEVESRKPAGFERNQYRRYVGGIGKVRDWLRWQELFDNLVHDLADHTKMSADEVIARASALADAMLVVIRDKRAELKLIRAARVAKAKEAA
jgi:hypothetical protein